MNKFIKLIRIIFIIVVLSFFGFNFLKDKATYELIDVKVYEVKDVVHTDTNTTKGYVYDTKGARTSKTTNDHNFYDIYIKNPSKYPEIKNVHESYMYDTDYWLSDSWKDDDGNEAYAVFEVYKHKKTGELDARFVEVENNKSDMDIYLKVNYPEFAK